MAKNNIDLIWDRIAEGIHSGKIKPGQVDPKLYKWTAEKIFHGVTGGFGGGFTHFDPLTADYKLLAHLETNVHIFSAFKTYQELREATDLLLDADKKLKTFETFRQDLMAVNEKYNVQYLEAEYDQAVASAEMASKWVDIEAQKEVLPLLQYSTAGDDRVREEHAVLDGIIRPVDDPFWDNYYPPNDWGCRCIVTQLSEGKVTEIEDKPLPELKPVFALNTAKQGVIFPDTHPYFVVQRSDKEDAKRLWNLNVPDKLKPRK